MSERQLSEFLKPPPRPSALEVDRQWWALRARLRRRSQLRRAAAIGSAVAVFAVAVALGVRTPAAAPGIWQGATVSSTAAPVSVSLQDGTRVELEPQTQVQVALQSKDDVLLLLDQGSVRLDVVKNPGRRFIVRAADVDVQVVGTQFEVRREGSQVSVWVLRGLVEVRSGEQLHRLTAGERWSRSLEASALVEPEAEAEPALVEPEPLPAPSRKRTRPARAFRQPAPAAPAPVAVAPPVAAPVVAAAPAPTARGAFEAAVKARSKGNPQEAIALFEQLLLQWPTSSFASLGAFELGRLQLDSRRDSRAAAAAFEKVLAIGSGSSLTEDAMGRLVEAYAAFDVRECRRVRARYLSAFPAGTHVKDVISSCPP